MAWNALATRSSRTEYLDALVERAEQGDAESFGDLYRLLYDEMTCYFFHRTGSGALAETLAHRLFVAVWQNLQRYDRGEPFMAWLYRLARQQVVEQRCAADTKGPDAAGVVTRGTEGKGRGDRRGRCSREDIERLPDHCRDVLILRLALGLSAREVSERLDLQVTEVRAVQVRALNELLSESRAAARSTEARGETAGRASL